MKAGIVRRVQGFFDWWSVERMGIALATLGLTVTVLGHLEENVEAFDLLELFRDLWANLGTELFSIALTVLIIDTLNQRREREQRAAREQQRTSAQEERSKQQLIRQLGSSVNDQAMWAAEELRAHGWLEDGSLQWAKLHNANLANANLRYAKMDGARLHRANLEEASLYKANLEGIRLPAANLQGASLGDANLKGADLVGAKLQSAYLAGVTLEGADMFKANLEGVRKFDERKLAGVFRLAGATMPDGSHYDGRYYLKADKEMARRDGVNSDDEQAMKTWYADIRRKNSPPTSADEIVE